MAKKTKKPEKKAARKPRKDKLGIPDVIPTHPVIRINEKGRDSMFKALRKSDHVDLLKIFEVYDESDKKARERIITHYERNGSLFINAVFRGDIEDAIKYSETPEMVKLLEKI